VLRVRFDDFTRATRSHTLARATAHTDTIRATASALLDVTRPAIEARGITLVGVAVANLADGIDHSTQLELPWDHHDTDLLDEAVDAIRDRFGSTALTRAALLGHARGIEVPLLPD
jgi:DNA polymerase-4